MLGKVVGDPVAGRITQQSTEHAAQGGGEYHADTIDEYGNPIDPSAAPSLIQEMTGGDDGYNADLIDEYGNPIDVPDETDPDILRERLR